jgi:hypothetical protein
MLRDSSHHHYGVYHRLAGGCGGEQSKSSYTKHGIVLLQCYSISVSVHVQRAEQRSAHGTARKRSGVFTRACIDLICIRQRNPKLA